jgi:hypothetical protein
MVGPYISFHPDLKAFVCDRENVVLGFSGIIVTKIYNKTLVPFWSSVLIHLAKSGIVLEEF